MLSILIPTYNERKNIGDLLEEVEEVLRNEKITGEIIVIDDNSPDKTWEIVENKMKVYNNIRLIKREKKLGLGSAYKRGFKESEGEMIIEMDADFSHDPKDIPRFVDKILECDVVVGSRYVKSGERNDPFFRKIFPLIGNFFYNFFLDFPVRDATSGYRAYKKTFLKKINLKKIPDDFSFQAAILFELSRKDAKITEIPIKFERRKSEKSKYSTRDLFSNLKLFVTLFFHRFI